MFFIATLLTYTVLVVVLHFWVTLMTVIQFLLQD
jgi:hypothetical protein